MTGAERQAKYRRKMADEGIVQTTIWIPRTMAQAFRRLAVDVPRDAELVGAVVQSGDGRLKTIRLR